MDCGRNEMLDSFLADEISDQVIYEGIIDFIISYNIRNGEYEGNRFIIKKMDLYNFIIFDEYEIDGKKSIGLSFSIPKKRLTKAINGYAEKQGYKLRHHE
ncbi:hypothetical protein HRF87_18375 [Bacillus sp. CRN 9]|nr:hypothetical protein [Bacillus sp. CRN 9]